MVSGAREYLESDFNEAAPFRDSFSPFWLHFTHSILPLPSQTVIFYPGRAMEPVTKRSPKTRSIFIYAIISVCYINFHINGTLRALSGSATGTIPEGPMKRR
jgi:hypothetical protein